MSAASDSVWREKLPASATAQGRNLVIVLAEAYGTSKDRAWSEFLMRPFRQQEITSRYNVVEGVKQFQGGTVSPELRELCHARAEIPSPGDDLGWMKACMPQQWNATHETTAIHGFTGYMFDRRTWYPRMGFQKILFLPELEREGVKRCNVAFDGACDEQIAKLIHRKIVASKRTQLIYWVTIDMHLPWLLRGLRRCSAERSARAIRRTRAYVSGSTGHITTIRRSRRWLPNPKLPATEFLIVGDHAPQFISNSRRQLFEAGVVSYVHLIPRDARWRNITSWLRSIPFLRVAKMRRGLPAKSNAA